MGARVLKFVAFGAVGVGAVLVIVAGVVGWVVVPKIIEDRVKKETQLVDTSDENDTYDKWRDLPVPIKLQVWFFHVTNYEEFVNATDWNTIPQIEEVGPFVWTEKREKYDIKVNEEEDTISYRQNITYVFDEEASGEGLTEDTSLTLVNVPLIAAITLLDIYPVTRKLAPVVLHSLIQSGETLFMPEQKPSDIMFKGSQLPPVYKSVEFVANLLGIPLPNELKNGKFAVYLDKNATNGEGVWEVYRGTKDSSLFNVVKSVNDGKTYLGDWWPGYCGMINGTDGSMFPPFLKKDQKLYVYAAEICRSIFLEFEKETEFEGIKGYRYTIPKELFTNPTVYPDNKCFCITPRKPLNDTCNASGVGRLFSCKENVPITISKPHFLDADDWIIEEAQKYGLSPQHDKHDTYLDLEPNTGFPLRLHKRIQVGVELQPYKSLVDDDIPEQFKTMPHSMYPLMWADESAELNEKLIDEVKSKLVKPLNYVKIGKWTGIGVGSFLFVAGLLYIGLTWKKAVD